MSPLRLWMCLGCLVALTACGDRGETTSGGGGSGGVDLPPPKPLVVATWNLHNFYNHLIDDPGQANLEATDPAWGQHRVDVGLALNAIDADILLLQEVESTEVLQELNQMELGGKYSEVVVIDANDPRGIDVAVMSKVPLDATISHADEFFAKEGTSGPDYIFARDVLEVHLTFNGRAIVMLNVHYKAKENDNPDKRLAEAQRTRAIADEITAAAPETALIIAGDFNDLPGSPPYDAAAGAAPDAYTNAAIHVDEADRWTFDFQGTLELVDHQLSNPLMTDRLDTTSVTIRHDPEFLPASDHAPIIATYQIN
jgi:endonuclease/exonuclease/phosphatase family metal-dependent hydrolase